MKKLPLSLILLLSLAAPFARAGEQTFYYWTNTNGGNWTAKANWVMEDGSAATTYPHVTGDIAVFNGLGPQKTVSVNNGDVIDIDEMRFVDGCTRIGVHSSAHFHIDAFLRSGGAHLYFVNSSGYNWAGVNDFTIGNRDDILFNEGLIPGVLLCKDNGGWGNPRSVTVDDTDHVKFGQNLDSVVSGYDVSKDTTVGAKYTFLYGNYQQGRNVTFKNECTLTVPCGQISPVNAKCHFGTAGSAAQGTVSTEGATLFYWPGVTTSPTIFRPKVLAPRFVQCGHGVTLYCDDHSSETNEYPVASGTMMLGSVPLPGADGSVTNRCVLGTGPVVVSWAGTLDVGAEDAMKKSEYLKMTSFRGLGETYGKIHMSTNAVVDWFWLDDKLQKRGTHGATGSGAEFVDDAIFSGPGLLTVKKGSDETLFLIY